MLKDFELFKEIRLKGNSGLYTYRTKNQIDSIYTWAENEIKRSKTYRDFYTILCQVTDYEGSLHNGTYWSDALRKSIRKESTGYFPLPLKVIEGKLRVNSKGKEIPLGSEIISINDHTQDQLIRELGKYYTTDGYNTTGKNVGITKQFSSYYRYYFGLEEVFDVVYQAPDQSEIQRTSLKSTSYKQYYENFDHRHSSPIDNQLYEDNEEENAYYIKKIGDKTAVLTINTFSLGSAKTDTHLQYKSFLDSVFTDLNQHHVENLILDVRNNGGGNPPNDLVTLSYLTDLPQKEIQTAWIGFTESIPYWKYLQLDIPFYFKPLAKGKLNKIMKQQLPLVKDDRRYYKEIKSYEPNENRFHGQVYLLVAAPIASAASLFSSMVASNTDAIVVGEETMGGYYGHNGSFSMEYKLPKSNFTFAFSIVNLTQDVKEKENQPFGRGVMPDYSIVQSFDDFMNQEDTQMNYVLDLIKKRQNNQQP